MAERSAESTRAIQEKFESDFFRTIGSYYATGGAGAGSPNNINGFPHMIVSDGTNDAMTLKQIIKARLSLDKANVPAEGRVLIVDPVVEATLNGMVTLTSDITPFAANILQNGIGRGQRWMGSLYGFDIISSNRLHVGTYNDGTNSVTGGVGNVAMSILDDQTKPVMAAWRRQPKAEGKAFALSSLNNVEVLH